jgi:hypothetical protein
MPLWPVLLPPWLPMAPLNSAGDARRVRRGPAGTPGSRRGEGRAGEGRNIAPPRGFGRGRARALPLSGPGLSPVRLRGGLGLRHAVRQACDLGLQRDVTERGLAAHLCRGHRKPAGGTAGGLRWGVSLPAPAHAVASMKGLPRIPNPAEIPAKKIRNLLDCKAFAPRHGRRKNRAFQRPLASPVQSASFSFQPPPSAL